MQNNDGFHQQGVLHSVLPVWHDPPTAHMIAIMSSVLTPLFADAELRLFNDGAWLFREGDQIRAMYLVGKGAVDLVRVTSAGTLVILQRARSGQVLAEASAYSKFYHCGARAAAATSVHQITVSRFRKRLTGDPMLAEIWAAHLAYSMQAARFRAEIRTMRTVAERLDAWLGELKTLPPKGAWQDLASELGVSREALYRELSRRRRNRG